MAGVSGERDRYLFYCSEGGTRGQGIHFFFFTQEDCHKSAKSSFHSARTGAHKQKQASCYQVQMW